MIPVNRRPLPWFPASRCGRSSSAGHWSRITKAGIVQAPWESLPAKGFNTSKRFKTSGEWQWLSTRPGDIE